MSAKKRAMIRLDRREYDELKKLEKMHIKDRSNVSWHQAEVAAGYVQGNINEMLERQEEYQQMVTSLNGELDQIENQNHQALLQQEQEFLNHISTLESEMGHRTEDLLQQQDDIFNAVIDDLQFTHAQEIEDLSHQLEDLDQSIQEKREIALNLIEDVDQYYEWMRNAYDWEFFNPQILMEFEHQIDQATENYYQGLLEASILQNQQTRRELQKARMQMEQRQAEWSFLRGVIDQRITQYEQVIQESQFVQPVDLKMNIIEDVEPLNVNLWSQGKLGKITEALDGMKSAVQEENCKLQAEEMREWLSSADTLDDDIAATIMLARYNALDAQIRRNLATVVTEVMEENGFQVVDHNADTSGIHEPFFVLMQDDHGGEMSIDITPEQGYINNISIEMADKSPVMEYELEERRREVVAELSRRGVAVERLDNPQSAPPVYSHYGRQSEEFDDTILKKRKRQRVKGK